MQKAANRLGNEDETLRAFALQTLSGTAAELAERLLNEIPNITWEELEGHFTHRYNDVVDPEYSRQLLTRKIQRKNESVTAYFESLLTIPRVVLSPLCIPRLSSIDAVTV